MSRQEDFKKAITAHIWRLQRLAEQEARPVDNLDPIVITEIKDIIEDMEGTIANLEAQLKL